MKSISLNIIDRLTISSLLAEKEAGNRLEMTLIRNLLRVIEFTPAEIETCGIKEDEKGLKYKKDCEVEVDMSDEQAEILRSCIDRADKENRIHIQMLGFLDKFDDIFK